MEPRVTVFKLGGSLLELPDLAQRLACLLTGPRLARPLLVVGGGAVADLVRRWDAVHDVGSHVAHDLALSAMALNEQLVARLLPASRIVRTPTEAVAAWSAEEVAILNCRGYLQEVEGCGVADLPHTWDATSDSIAAWVSLCWPARELVLLKSVDLPDATTTQQASEAKLVDACFPRFAARIESVAWINLRGRLVDLVNEAEEYKTRFVRSEGSFLLNHRGTESTEE
ncbi:MAG: uridylate kinase [Planctomycetaceae bacterium]|nr:uridylate kinase [Planctomycetaceae bacterium]